VSSWRAIVMRLDQARARAFAMADVAPLAAVYVPGSSAYASDLTTVRSLASRGLRARGFTATVERVVVDSLSATTARLRVTDRLSGYDLVDASGRVVGHGAPRPTRTFTMTLQQTAANDWRVATISNP
jgi:hypothetical protein